MQYIPHILIKCPTFEYTYIQKHYTKHHNLSICNISNTYISDARLAHNPISRNNYFITIICQSGTWYIVAYSSLYMVYTLISIHVTCLCSMVFALMVYHTLRTFDCMHYMCMCMLNTYCCCSSCAIVCFIVCCLCHATYWLDNVMDAVISCCDAIYIGIVCIMLSWCPYIIYIWWFINVMGCACIILSLVLFMLVYPLCSLYCFVQYISASLCS